MVSDGCLEQVTGTIEFVHVAQVRPALVFALQREEGVQVAVGVLSRFNFGNHFVHQVGNFLVRLDSERPRRCFQPLVNIAVVEIKPAKFASHFASDSSEIVNSPRLLHQFVLGWDGDFPKGDESRLPKAVSHLNGADWDGAQLCVRAFTHANDDTSVSHSFPTFALSELRYPTCTRSDR
jgi:hypothetical protein